VAATVEPRPGAPGYSWLRITFYSFPFTEADRAAAMKGHLESMDARWTNKATNPKDYNHSNAVIQLGVDKNWKVWQVDMSVPGHACTIAGSEREVKAALQEYRFDGTRLRLRGKGSFVCEMNTPGVPNRRYGWDLDLDVPGGKVYWGQNGLSIFSGPLGGGTPDPALYTGGLNNRGVCVDAAAGMLYWAERDGAHIAREFGIDEHAGGLEEIGSTINKD
jgi:hypothetical protein